MPRNSHLICLTLCLLSVFCFQCRAQTVDRIESFQLTPGQTARLAIFGKGLSEPVRLWTPFGNFACQPSTKETKGRLIYCDATIPESVTPGIYEVRVLAANGISEETFVVVDDLASHIPTGNSEDHTSPALLPNACCFEGQINPQKPRYFKLGLKRGQRISVEVYARRLNSLLDPVLRLLHADGREVCFADDTAGLSGDAQIEFKANSDGDYILELRDVKHGGGGNHFYHVRVGNFPLIQGVYPRRTSGGSVRFLSDQAEDLQETLVVDNGVKESIRQIAVHQTGGSCLGSVVLTTREPILESEPNNVATNATYIDSNQLVAGRIQKPGDTDWYRIKLAEKQHLSVSTHTRNVGSPADIVLELYDAEQKLLQKSDDSAPMDAQLSKIVEPGEYYICVKELTGSGGTAWTYDLEFESGGRLELVTKLDRITIPAEGSGGIPVELKRIGFDQPFELFVRNLPIEFLASSVFVSSSQQTAFLTISAVGQGISGEIAKIELAARIQSGEEIPVVYRADSTATNDHKLMRHQTGAFICSGPKGKFSIRSRKTTFNVKAGTPLKIPLEAIRTDGWTEPIAITSLIPAAELPAGLTIGTTNIESDVGEVILTVSDQAKTGKHSISLSGQSQKGKTVVVQPAPSITIVVD